MPAAEKIAGNSVGQESIDPKALIKGYGSMEQYAPELDVIDWTSPVYDQVLAREEQAATQKKNKHSSAA